MSEKACSKCGVVHPATTEYFHRDKKNKSGLTSRCKKCIQEYTVSHAERRHETGKRHRENNPEYYYNKTTNWRRTNVERTRLQSRIDARNYHERYPEAAKLRSTRKKTIRENGEFMADDWQFALEYWDNRCAVCGRPPGLFHKLSQDHWIAVTKNGQNVPDNVIPLCHGDGSCNGSKGNRDPLEWLTWKFGKRKAGEISAKVEQFFAVVRERLATSNEDEGG